MWGGTFEPMEGISQERGTIGGKMQLEPEGGPGPVVMVTASSVRSAPSFSLACLRRQLNHTAKPEAMCSTCNTERGNTLKHLKAPLSKLMEIIF